MAESARISCIVPGLYVGTLAAARDRALLSRLGITHVCSCIGGDADYPEQFRYLMLNFNDRVSTDLRNPVQQFLEWVSANRAAMGVGNVFVYCGAGMSRSPALAVAFLMCCEGMTFDQAIQSVRRNRGPRLVNINDGFIKQLREMESELMGPTRDH